MFDLTHVQQRKHFLRENIAQVELRSIISTSIVYHFGGQNRRIPRATASILYIFIYILYMDSQKQLKLCRFPQRTCKLMRLKVVI